MREKNRSNEKEIDNRKKTKSSLKEQNEEAEKWVKYQKRKRGLRALRSRAGH